jgi:DNA-binding response OmpR family regulator
MAIKVLLADNDLDIHKLISDLLPLIFKNVVVDKALNSEVVLTKLSDASNTYNLIILDLGLGDIDGGNILETIAGRFPEVLSRMVLILAAPEALPPGEPYTNIARVVKPFSLDEFGELAKKACHQ